jgi:hypothetical protein
LQLAWLWLCSAQLADTSRNFRAAMARVSEECGGHALCGLELNPGRHGGYGGLGLCTASLPSPEQPPVLQRGQVHGGRVLKGHLQGKATAKRLHAKAMLVTRFRVVFVWVAGDARPKLTCARSTVASLSPAWVAAIASSALLMWDRSSRSDRYVERCTAPDAKLCCVSCITQAKG